MLMAKRTNTIMKTRKGKKGTKRTKTAKNRKTREKEKHREETEKRCYEWDSIFSPAAGRNHTNLSRAP